MRWLHRYTRLLAVASLLLITAGGLVTSTGSGLAVPDWPNTYGYFMFAFPLSGMVGGIFYEHGHRLIASVVGMLTIGLAIWLARVEPRRWVRRLGWIALAAVVVQGILGGITVLYFLPAPISISHAGLAQLFFTLIVSLAIFTSPGWHDRYRGRAGAADGPDAPSGADPILARLAVLLPAVIYLQILVGATMRHTGAGLAIPDFPLVFGGLVPPEWTSAIAIHYAHRVGAVLTTALVFATAAHALHHHGTRAELARPSMLLCALVVVQVGLGGWTVWSSRQVAINTAHVSVGALLLVTSVVLALRVHRGWFTDAADDRLAGSSIAAGRLRAGSESPA
ncbi:MAG: heme A synthase [Acidobacteria bacterium]|nr:heme A synthase [Acidobacteriota bacterium]MYD71734.1 heme A synthase [Acidobacteriota bacterium]MYJ05891.1 heme A synthase [Acidobacteriota bacterium]